MSESEQKLPANLASAFKAYDIRGRLPDELNEYAAYRIGLAYGELFGPGKVAVGRDIRLSGPTMVAALTRGLLESGCDVMDLGMVGTEEVYHAVAHQKLKGGIAVTASHNPADYNGMKLVREDARPISADTGLKELLDFVQSGKEPTVERKPGKRIELDGKAAYIDDLLAYVKAVDLRPYRIVANCGNGSVGPALETLREHLPFEFTVLQGEPDGEFPNGVPNPLLMENRQLTADALAEAAADFAIAWDGDFDRCFFWDENGRFIEGYYVIGLLAQRLLRDHPGAKVVHDPRLYWNTVDVVSRAGGKPVMSKSGHAFIKERMRIEGAIYGGEMSAHHYFQSFSYCDSGMVPMLLVAALMSETGEPLSALVDDMIERYPCSGEINRTVDDPDALLKRIEDEYAGGANRVDYTDGLSIDHADWRFNIRKSNTEPLVRINVEARGDRSLLETKTKELLRRIEAS
ncbi:MAG: phosphomannomutase [Gammaproteobacteria bacterium]|nr:phosphomannomutase [Gammaproteobacteria bacterium]